jgi:PPP family 3-phenylpropionic acid transporter
VCLLQWFFYMAFGAGIPFLTIYFKRTLVLPGGEPAVYAIGLVVFLNSIVGTISTPFAGFVADRFHIENRLVTSLASFTALGMLGVLIAGLVHAWPLSSRLALILVGYTLSGLFLRPIVPLIDTEALAYVRARHGQSERYGRIRLFGTLGWIFGSASIGWVVSRADDPAVAIGGYTLGFVVLALVAATGFRAKVEKVAIPWSHLRRDVVFRRYLFFVLVLFLGMTNAFVFTGYFLDDARVSFAVIGLSFAVGAIGEIPVMFWAHRLLRRWGNRGIILIGCGLTILKLLMFYVGAGMESVLLLVCGQLLMGPSFAMLYVGFVNLVDGQAHPDMRATYQSLHHLVGTLGQALGGPFAALVMTRIGSRGLMGADAVVVSLAALYFLFMVKGRAPTK